MITQLHTSDKYTFQIFNLSSENMQITGLYEEVCAIIVWHIFGINSTKMLCQDDLQMTQTQIIASIYDLQCLMRHPDALNVP